MSKQEFTVFTSYCIHSYWSTNLWMTGRKIEYQHNKTNLISSKKAMNSIVQLIDGLDKKAFCSYGPVEITTFKIWTCFYH